VTHIYPLDRADRQRFETLKMHEYGGRHSDKKRKIASLADRHRATFSILPNTSIAEMGDRLTTIDMDRKLGGCVPFGG